MKLSVSFKNPDAVHTAVDEFIETTLSKRGLMNDENDMSDQEMYDLFEETVGLSYNDICDRLGKFIRFGEYVSIEFDLEKGTAEVKSV